jgi:hypothetical protein
MDPPNIDSLSHAEKMNMIPISITCYIKGQVELKGKLPLFLSTAP